MVTAINLGEKTISNYNALGDILFKLNNYNEAHNAFLIAYSMDSLNIITNRNIAITSYYLDNLDNAIYYLLNIINQEPKDTQTYVLLAEIYNTRGNYKLGLNYINLGLNLDSNDHYGNYIKGLLEYNLEDYNEAIRYHTNAIELYPFNPDYFHKRGMCYYSLNMYNKAISDFDKCIDLDLNYSYAYLSKAYTYKDLNNDSLACLNYKIYLEIDSSNSEYKGFDNCY